MGLRTWLSGTAAPDRPCGCEPSAADGRLSLDANGCEGGGRLATEPDCRETAVAALTGVDADTVVVRADGIERAYRGTGGALLLAAARFAPRVRSHDPRLADRARRDPLAAAREAVGRAGHAADVAAETGLADVAAAADGDGDGSAFEPVVGPTVSRWRVDPALPAAPLRDVRDLDTGGTVRRYGDGSVATYHLVPRIAALEPRVTTAVAAAADRLTDPDGADTPRAAVGAVGEDLDAGARETATAVLEKHASGHGLLADLFADPAVSDAFVTAPVERNPVRVVVDGDLADTNVWLAAGGAAALASQLRRASGRAFSRAAPTVDASLDVAERTVRVAGLRPPAADGLSFAFRAHDRDRWRLPELVANGTLTPAVAGLLSVAVERGRSLLIAGPRGAGKTTLLGALLWELPPGVRVVTIEDTPELPVAGLQGAGRDVQAVRTGADGGEIGPAEALRTALRLGDGALVVGEVRGEEAAVLYEAMRVGATDEAVLGTIHGDGAAAVRERVVTDLGVSPTAFAATDAVVTLASGPAGRHVATVEEVVGDAEFEPLYSREDGQLRATGRIDRGNSRLVAALAEPEESYGTVRGLLSDRADRFEPAGEPRDRR